MFLHAFILDVIVGMFLHALDVGMFLHTLDVGIFQHTCTLDIGMFPTYWYFTCSMFLHILGLTLRY